MENNKNIYTFGACIICKKAKPLKNNVCSDCEEKEPQVPEIFKDLFGGIFNDGN